MPRFRFLERLLQPLVIRPPVSLDALADLFVRWRKARQGQWPAGGGGARRYLAAARAIPARRCRCAASRRGAAPGLRGNGTAPSERRQQAGNEAVEVAGFDQRLEGGDV